MRRCSGTFDKAGSDAGLPRLRDADHSREGRQGRRGFSREKRGVRSGLGVMFGLAHAKDAKGEKDGFRREGSTGMMTPLLGYGEAARMWESFFAANVAPFADLA